MEKGLPIPTLYYVLLPFHAQGLHVDGAGRRVLVDISRGKEKIPVSCVNSVDNDPFPLDFIYIADHLMQAAAARRVVRVWV